MSPDMTYVGLENYRMILSEPRVQHAFVNNLKWLVYYLVVPTSVGLGLALLLDSDLPGTYVFRTIFFIPFTITTVAVASVWRWIYEPNIGLLSEVLKAVGLGARPQLARRPVYKYLRHHAGIAVGMERLYLPHLLRRTAQPAGRA